MALSQANETNKMGIFGLNEDAIKLILDQLEHEDLVNFSLANKHIQETARQHLGEHRHLVRKYSIICIDHGDSCDHTRGCGFICKHPASVLIDIVKRPKIASYIRLISFIRDRDVHRIAIQKKLREEAARDLDLHNTLEYFKSDGGIYSKDFDVRVLDEDDEPQGAGFSPCLALLVTRAPRLLQLDLESVSSGAEVLYLCKNFIDGRPTGSGYLRNLEKLEFSVPDPYDRRLKLSSVIRSSQPGRLSITGRSFESPFGIFSSLGYFRRFAEVTPLLKELSVAGHDGCYREEYVRLALRGAQQLEYFRLTGKKLFRSCYTHYAQGECPCVDKDFEEFYRESQKGKIIDDDKKEHTGWTVGILDQGDFQDLVVSRKTPIGLANTSEEAGSTCTHAQGPQAEDVRAEGVPADSAQGEGFQAEVTQAEGA